MSTSIPEGGTPPQPAENDNKGGQSGNYTPPASQADLDRIVAERLSRERAKFADYDDLKTKAEKLAEIEASQLSEAEKTAARIAALEAENQGFKTKEQVSGWKKQVSEETGVPAAALKGSSLEELQAHAEALKPLIAAAAPPEPPAPPAGPTVPGEGGTPPAGVAQLTAADLKSMTPEQINKARREGRFNKLLGV
ncbi:hypothetical protein [Promicromonospora sp. NFX87]|uniref:hypothetical protein n=1 Tax=Promicromonospora sp. NFX87 TaxID=3402691 RepID=UPI003AFA644B